LTVFVTLANLTLFNTQAEGTAAPSFTPSWLSRISNDPKEEYRQKLMHIMKFIAGSAFLAGYETVSLLPMDMKLTI
jgi:hypothetical protein